mmetsp:Transcript_3413/g.7629  ORF Transcript_3413/g.7629 Transcript_3413/m.7629 type:complete len:265 (-) Transcript_3413:461-1255(-)
MGRAVPPPITEQQKRWALKQHVFFVASAPLSGSNHVNVSPKSAAEFRFVDADTVGYLDLTGSGAETPAHIMENGRLTIMFVAFKGAPKIMRFYGRGEVVLADALLTNPKHEKLRQAWDINAEKDWESVVGARSIVLLHVDRIADSCGFSIPIYDYVKDRNTLTEVSKQTDMKEYQRKKNSFSIDGLKGVAQTIYKDIPTSRTLEEGYYMAPTDWNVGQNPLKKLKIRALMLWASGLNGRIRDLVFFIFGVVSLHLAKKAISTRR